MDTVVRQKQVIYWPSFVTGKEEEMFWRGKVAEVVISRMK
jgi:hypothetical protein